MLKNSKINLEKKNILDLYSGVGSFGIECLSRDVTKLYLLKKILCFFNFKKNILKLDLSAKTELVSQDIK